MLVTTRRPRCLPSRRPPRRQTPARTSHQTPNLAPWWRASVRNTLGRPGGRAVTGHHRAADASLQRAENRRPGPTICPTQGPRPTRRRSSRGWRSRGRWAEASRSQAPAGCSAAAVRSEAVVSTSSAAASTYRLSGIVHSMAWLVSSVASSKYSARPGASTTAVTSATGLPSHSESSRSVLGPGPSAIRPSGNVITGCASR